MIAIEKTFMLECKQKLLDLRRELMNRARHHRDQMLSQDPSGSGDEIDQTVAQLEEENFVRGLDRIRKQLMEIDAALGRIESGGFGICEETQEPIEEERLRALPYTRLSIEGAELREAIERRFAMRR